MIQPIIHDPFLLAKKSEVATMEDKQVAIDLLDTIKANSERCVGMAANMIGVSKRIIVVDIGNKYLVMFNPNIIEKKDAYEIEEGCLSLAGVRKTTRYRRIIVQFNDDRMKSLQRTFIGFSAQIIQHEVDHCDGILI